MLDLDIQYAYNICMSSKVFNLSLPVELVEQLDKQAKKDFTSRSDYIRRAVLNQLRSEQGLTEIFDRANKKGKLAGYISEEQVYKKIADK